jgi:hypothetical protein
VLHAAIGAALAALAPVAAPALTINPIATAAIPAATAAPIYEKPNFIFPRSRATPPSLGTPTDLPLPNLAWETKTQPALITQPALTFPNPILELPVPSIRPVSIVPRVETARVAGVSEGEVSIVAKEEKQVASAVVKAAEAEKIIPVVKETVAVVVTEKKQEVEKQEAKVAKAALPPVCDGQSALLREIERRGRERVAEQEKKKASAVVVHVAPILVAVEPTLPIHVAPIVVPGEPTLPKLTAEQGDDLRKKMEELRDQIEADAEDGVWDPADDM